MGCNRTLIRPRKPIVLRNAVTTSHFFAARIKSWLRINFDTAAAISGVIPREIVLRTSELAFAESSQSRNDPTVSEEMTAKASGSWPSTIRRVTSSAS